VSAPNAQRGGFARINEIKPRRATRSVRARAYKMDRTVYFSAGRRVSELNIRSMTLALTRARATFQPVNGR